MHVHIFRAFEGWKREFNKEYDIEQEADTFITWLDNWYMINKHNSDDSKSYKLRMNEFSDLNSDQFRKHIHGSTESCLATNQSITQQDKPTVIQMKHQSNLSYIPVSWDWTDIDGTSWVTPVKNQGNCGGCWAFSSVGAIESASVIKNYYNQGTNAPQPIPQLSEQQLIGMLFVHMH